ncbi:bifunctional phosphatase PAP2/diacylglycerol kinase family protein [Amycolatopsis sp. FDAARGOS 1241]|uniref:bifunctional phosphatase PAP2/diacylglycerol kinase family protein n=1 Tax=Amycolatopsis sp. FDAARGOS 1241 TaxID=2778070 RepID=UPI0019516E1E|nr:bifunctional phosphatase PAP2/diacylglycerol kinase family protein [Amycolatopsis sp. FDAARGOS 1241]QRP49992.1 phosphatase PAP2 family protein [Amycolatopsis sp. FDAARGOS 1241]
MFHQLSRPFRKVGRTDRALIARSAALPRTRGDDVLGWLSKSANKSRLWWAVAGLLATRKGATRRGALRGVAAIAGASAAANLLGKPLFPRRRPAEDEVPEHRRLRKRPTSSSFPSGHAASAAAFATAVAMESPRAGLAVAPLAGAVAYSRVHTGVHWPSDVGAGVVIGVTVATLTRHWWPLHPDVPARTAHTAEAPEMRDGEDMLALVNPHSGVDGQDLTEDVRFAWPKATLLYPDARRDLREQLKSEIDARGGTVRALGVAGGDGTVAAVASVAAERGLPLALIPAGTLNHFARDVGVRSMPDADAATEAGNAVGIDLGEVEVHGAGETEHRWFVNTASLGGYPEMVRLREKLQEKHPKWPSAALALARVLRRAKPLPVLLNGERTEVWLIFVGNGTYSPKGFAPSRRPALDTGVLDVRYLRADLPYSRARFLLAMITNSLNASHVYQQLDVSELRVELFDGNRRVATDGEVGPLGKEFVFRARPSALTIYRNPDDRD